MTDIEVHADLRGQTCRVGTLYAPAPRNSAATVFEYHDEWLANENRFALEPALALGRGPFAPDAGLFGSIGDSAPDTWGRRLMQRAERRAAAREDRRPKTLTELDYLLGVNDHARLGALRFKRSGDDAFQATGDDGVPSMIALGKLLTATERIERGEETDDDLKIIFAPGSSLGGARPKASVFDQHGQLSIAKFPKQDDDWRIELWESVALHLAKAAGIEAAQHKLIQVAGKTALLSKRFDRHGDERVPFLSGLSALQLKDGEQASYPELVVVLNMIGAQAALDSAQLFRRMLFNIMISNVDDHGRNHGFLYDGAHGWKLSPAYDLNPVPTDVKARVLSTSISLDDATCDLQLALSVADDFGLSLAQGKAIASQVGRAVSSWRDVAKSCGAKASEIRRMESAFEHDDLAAALAL